MTYRRSWFAGVGSLLFAGYLLSGLLIPGRIGIPWQVVVVASAAAGLVVTAAAVQYRLRAVLIGALNVVIGAISITLVTAPESTVFYLPTLASRAEVAQELELALELIRTSVEPVVALPGVLVILMAVFWAGGALLAWGLMRGHPYVGLLPPLIISLQLATMNRSSTGVAATAVFVCLVAWSIFAVEADQRSSSMGRMAPRHGRRPRRLLLASASSALVASAIIGSVAAVAVASSSVPPDGSVRWRIPAGLTGQFFGGETVVYNTFVGIHQQVINPSNAPVFEATLSSDMPTNQVYFQLLTLETFDDGNFRADRPVMRGLDEGDWVSSGHAFAGPTAELEAHITIKQVRNYWLPGVSGARAITTDAELAPNLSVRTEDGAIRVMNGSTLSGMQYLLESDVPAPDLDTLSRHPTTGALSGLFATGLNRADVPNELDASTLANLLRPAPPDADRLRSLPSEEESRIDEIRNLAQSMTTGLETDFEKALRLEDWLRGFDYTTNIAPGQGATDLAAWLLDEGSPNFHAGYCENFATALAVMARTLRIPSRVVLGFTPGEPDATQPGTVIVRDRNAHAWVELWMPLQGWVRFDPTPRGDVPATIARVEAALDRDLSVSLATTGATATTLPASTTTTIERNVGTTFGPGVDELPESPRIRGLSPFYLLVLFVAMLAPAIVLLGAIPFIKWLQRRRRMKRLDGGDISAAWEDITTRLVDLGEYVDPASTPREIADRYDVAIVPLANVYGKSVYGGSTKASSAVDVAVATMSLGRARKNIADRYPPRARLAAQYRIGELLPRWMRRNGRRR